MKTTFLCLCAALAAALVIIGCRGEPRLTIAFTGDDRGWVVPSG
ncbi:MAG: hypothetical protein ABR899_07835 [Candidatus Krumholzibacteriaceae bacterium]|jgi:hypothetical protein